MVSKHKRCMTGRLQQNVAVGLLAHLRERETGHLFHRRKELNQVSREEKKFLINREEYYKKSHQLSQVLAQDKNNGSDGYLVRSLYFDTIYDKDFYDKQDGIETRRKIRLRCYDPGNDFALLEMKQKQGCYQMKRSLRVSREDAVRLTKGDYSPLLHYPESFAQECYALMQCQCYRPKTIVQYQRKAFVAKENKIRITFDSRIESTESCFDLFSPKLNMNPVLDAFQVVLEVKYNGFLLEYIKRMLNSIDKSELSVSKYCLARQNAYQTRL